MTDATDIGRTLVVLVTALVGVAVAFVLFVVVPENLVQLLGVVLVLAVVGAALRTGSRLANSLLPGYDVAEVAVEGTITRDGGRAVPTQPGGTPADDIVEEIERADADDAAEALVVKLNTPGGEVVPSEDIRKAAVDFDGPTVAYATDTCASGGYWIASGCDEFWAREGSVVGSIGVILSQVRVDGLAEKLGVNYEGFTAGEYKDAGMPLKEIEEYEREYFQGLTDEYYDQFVDRVAEGRDMDPEAIRDTEARVYLGADAAECGLVDELGDREAVEDALAARLGVPEVTVREFEPEHGLAERLRGGAQSLAFAFGAGVASAVGAEDGWRFEFR